MTNKSKAHLSRLNELLDSAQTLFFQKGYEKTSVQNIIDAVDVAKGTFYHYFKSKDDLLEQLLDRQVAQVMPVIQAVLSDDKLNAIEKLNALFKMGGLKKAQSKEIILMLTRTIYDDSNLKMRVKQAQKSKAQVLPIFEAIIDQGIEDNLFETLPAQEAAELIVNLQQSIGDTIVPLFLTVDQHPENLAKIEARYQALEYAMERILGIPPQSIHIFNREVMDLFTRSNHE